jgi:predicted aminopeptidase
LKASKGKFHALRLGLLSSLLIAVTQLVGCYYVQAVRGHYEIMNKRQPIPEVIASEESPEELRNRLLIVQEARAFAVEELLLADNDSYLSYADIGRDYVVWNVFAAPEFSLEPKTWCFPVAGCVAYRGYFAEEAAQKKARSLSEDGYDTAVGGVSAYSTLGRFDDPVLNTMMRWSDTRLVATIFHELAHQKLYIKGDTPFNESFATAVSDIGINRWIAERNDAEGAADFDHERELRRSMMFLVNETKDELNRLYASGQDAAEMRQRKRTLLDELSANAGQLIEKSGTSATNWLAAPLNNARLVPLGLYEGYQEAFERIFRNCQEQLACFYEESLRLADLDPDERRQQLEQSTD